MAEGDITVFDNVVQEKSSCLITGVLSDEEDLPITLGQLSSLAITLTNKNNGAAIATINGLTSERVSVDANGNFKWHVDPDNNPVLIPKGKNIIEQHIALIRWVWNPQGLGFQKTGGIQVEIPVRNIFNIT